MRVVHDEEELDWAGQDCFFCDQRAPVRGQSCFIKMSKMMDAEGGGVKVLHSQVAVPRCAECATAHATSGPAFPGGIVAAVAVFLVLGVWQPVDVPGWGTAILMAGAFLLGRSMSGKSVPLPAGVRNESEAEAFVSVEAMRRGGWTRET